MGSVDRQAGIEKNKQVGLQLVILGHRHRWPAFGQEIRTLALHTRVSLDA